MTMRSPFYRLALEANERQADIRDDVLPVPTLDERVNLYLRAVYGNREFTKEERSNARNALLDSMAAEITAQVRPEVAEPRPQHPYDAPTQYRQNVRRKETIRAVPIARRPSILALTATFGLVLIVAAGTLGYRWTYPHMADEITAPAQQAGVPPPTTSPRSLSTVPAPGEAAPAQQASVPPPTSSPRSPEPSPDKTAPGHVLQIVSRRGDAHMLNVFLRLKQEQPALFDRAALKPIGTAQPPSTALSYAAQQARGERPYGAGPFTGQLGPFASKEDAAAACRALEAADIQCISRPEGK
jgi:hypothetical protein